MTEQVNTCTHLQSRFIFQFFFFFLQAQMIIPRKSNWEGRSNEKAHTSEWLIRWIPDNRFLRGFGTLFIYLFIYYFFIYFYWLEANYFTILQWFLSYIGMNQPWIYMYSPSDPPSHLPLHPIPLGLPSAPGLSNWNFNCDVNTPTQIIHPANIY